MKNLMIAAAALALLAPVSASAQFLGKEDNAGHKFSQGRDLLVAQADHADALYRAEQAALEAVGNPGRP